MMKLCTLASGSKGNCTFVTDGKTSLLIDCGIKLEEVEKRLQSIGVFASSINAIIVTHEHGDHIGGINAFVKKHKTKVFVHQKTQNIFASKLGKNTQGYLSYFNDFTFDIGSLQISSFAVPHDSAFCFGYTVSSGTEKVGYATDLGTIGMAVVNQFAGCSVVVLESNHCVNMLKNNDNYPLYLKNRILGKSGHLSNDMCARAIYQLATMGVPQIVLAHLSEENNSPIVAYNTIKDFLASKGVLEGVHIAVDIAPQHTAGEMFEIE